MPYKIRKISNKRCYKVYNTKTKKVYAKCTTKEKAKSQIRLLMAIEKNAIFRQTLKNKRKLRA